jgi:hypothetical protein
MRICTILVAAISLPCWAATEHQIVCPASLPRTTIQITTPPQGWTPFVPFEYRQDIPLHSAGIMWGPPSMMGVSKPPIIRTVKGKPTEKWDELGREPSGKWMGCYYGENRRDDFVLSQPLPDNTTECTVTYGKKAGDVAIMCKW